MFRVGFSKDIHKLVPGRKLILAGVIIPFDKGELAHSDGDVVYHAVGESILGALAFGDLGKHFPDTDPKYKDINSSLLIKEIVSMMKKEGYVVNNIDVFISLEKPKLKDYIEQMRNMLHCLNSGNAVACLVKCGTVQTEAHTFCRTHNASAYSDEELQNFNLAEYMQATRWHITDGDIRRAMQHNRHRFFDTPVSAVMTRTPKCVSPDMRIVDVQDLMNRNEIHAVLVVDDNGSLLGIVESFNCNV